MIANTPIVNVRKVHGIFLARPPILKISCSWWQAWMIEPEPRKSSALKKACVVRWNIAAAAPEPIATATGATTPPPGTWYFSGWAIMYEPSPNAATM